MFNIFSMLKVIEKDFFFLWVSNFILYILTEFRTNSPDLQIKASKCFVLQEILLCLVSVVTERIIFEWPSRVSSIFSDLNMSWQRKGLSFFWLSRSQLFSSDSSRQYALMLLNQWRQWSLNLRKSKKFSHSFLHSIILTSICSKMSQVLAIYELYLILNLSLTSMFIKWWAIKFKDPSVCF